MMAANKVWVEHKAILTILLHQRTNAHLHEKMQTHMLNETKQSKITWTQIKVTCKQPAVVLDPSTVSAKLLEIKKQTKY
jgi:hypothetical protein